MKLNWKKVTERKFKAGWRKMINKTFILPNGVQKDYDVLDEIKAVHMVAFSPEGKVILEKTYRPGPEKVVYDMPAGYIDANETPEQAAVRELLEETGMQGEVKLAGTSIDDAYRNTIRYTFVFTDCRKIKEPEVEDDEIFEIVEVDIPTFKKYLRSGQTTHSESGYIAMDFLGLL